MASMTRALAALTLALAVPSVAAPKKSLAIGSAKEDEPCPVTNAPAPQDVTYLRGLAFAFEPAPQEVRAQAIEDLGFIGDARALNPLAVLSLDPNPVLARAAIRAIGTIRHPRAEEILGNLVRHPTAQLGNRQLALSLLPFQNTVTALRQVHYATMQPLPLELINQARTLAAELRRPAVEEIPGYIAPAAPPAPTPTPSVNGDAK